MQQVPVGVLQQAQGLVGDGHLMLSVVVMNEAGGVLQLLVACCHEGVDQGTK